MYRREDLGRREAVCLRFHLRHKSARCCWSGKAATLASHPETNLSCNCFVKFLIYLESNVRHSDPPRNAEDKEKKTEDVCA